MIDEMPIKPSPTKRRTLLSHGKRTVLLPADRRDDLSYERFDALPRALAAGASQP